MRTTILALSLLFAPFLSASAQEITFENLDFDVMHNAVDFTKEDLVERVVLIHLWGTT